MRIDMRYVVTSCLFFALTFAASSASADEIGVEFDLGTTYTSDARYDLIDDNDYYGDLGANLSYTSDRLIPELELLFLYQRAFGDLNANRFSSDLNTEWRQRRFMLGADYGPTFFGFLRPSARAGAGWSMQTLRMRTTGPELTDRAHDFVAFGALGLGARLRIPADEGSAIDSVVLGVQTHYGYMYQTDATFDQLGADKDAYPEDDPWTRQDASIGSLNTSGQFWDMGLSMRLAF